MIRNIVLLTVLIVSITTSCETNSTVASKVKKPIENVLFIGNSYTYRNNGVDQMLGKLMKHRANFKQYHFERAAKGKYRLSKHWKDPDTWKIFNSRKWDKVILQEYSSGPIRNYNEFIKYGKLWSAKIREQNPQAKIYLYSTWGYKNTLEMADSLYSAYKKLGKEIDADVIPIGMVWEKVKNKIDLYEKDGAHPNPRGTYLNACMFYSYIFDGDLSSIREVNDPIEKVNQEKIKNWVVGYKTKRLL